MELYTLNGSFHPETLIENYEALIWTERYDQAGDFELVSGDIEKTIETLPLESFVSLRETPVPMVVESHKIRKPLRGKAFVTVKGRSFDSVLERRASVISLPADAKRIPWNMAAEKTSDAAYKAIRAVIGDTQSRIQGGVTVLDPINPMSELDRIPQINLPLPADYNPGTSKTYEIEAGNLYSVVLNLIHVNHHGIKAVRPTGSKTTVDVEIYNGGNLTGVGPNSDPQNIVVFDATFDQFDDATYLLSFQGSTNMAYIYGPNGASWRAKNIGPEPSGLARRVTLIDEMSDDNLNTDEKRKDRGLIELYKNNATALFDGETSIQVANLFNKPASEGGYGLGDILLLKGEYGLTRNVRVQEFIRTSEPSGEKAFPAFEVVDE